MEGAQEPSCLFLFGTLQAYFLGVVFTNNPEALIES